MAGFDITKSDATKEKVKPRKKYKRKRPGVRFDMTPMVDIAFLLLIFYMVSTVFSMPQSLELNLPPKGAKDVKVKNSKMLESWVNAEGKLFWYHNESSEAKMDLPQLISLDKLRDLLIEKNSRIDGLVTVLKIDPESKYEVMVRIVDEIQVVERNFKQQDKHWSYRFSIDDITEWEIEQMAKVTGTI